MKKYYKYPFIFLLIYALTYTGNASFNSFIPVYFDHIGFNKSTIGLLLAIGPFVTLIAQPVWGTACDRAKEKNSILRALLIGGAALCLLFPVTRNFYFVFLLMLAFTFFHSPVNYITDAITLEYLDTTKWKFGPVRLAGTVGFALMSILVGALARIDISNIFIVYAVAAIAGFFATYRLPRVRGHQQRDNKIRIFELFKNRELIILMSLNLIFNISFGFLTSFSPVYYKALGADNLLLGIIMFVSSMSELPFLLYSDKIVNKMGIRNTLFISSAIMCLRLILLYFVKNIYLVLPISLLHGLTYIVFVYSMATYMNREVPKELKATGQTINGFVAIGIARIIGIIFGGMLSDRVGIGQVFLYTSIFELSALAVFTIIMYTGSLRSKAII